MPLKLLNFLLFPSHINLFNQMFSIFCLESWLAIPKTALNLSLLFSLEFFSRKSDSTIANVHPSVRLSVLHPSFFIFLFSSYIINHSFFIFNPSFFIFHHCQALVQVQSSPVQVEGLGLSLWSLLPTTTANFSKCP